MTNTSQGYAGGGMALWWRGRVMHTVMVVICCQGLEWFKCAVGLHYGAIWVLMCNELEGEPVKLLAARPLLHYL